MTLNAPGIPSKVANHEVLKAMDYHTEDVLVVCRRIMEMRRSGIEARFFEEGSP